MKSYCELIFCLMLSVLLASCSTPDGATTQVAPDNNSENIIDVSTLTEDIPSIQGPKRTVAVGAFASIGSFDSKYGEWDVGGGLGAMFATALVESDRFIVIERANVEQVLSEQEMAGNNLTTGTTRPELGRMIGVQYMLYGAVTEFGDADEGGGVSVGLAGGLSSLFSGALSRESASGSVAMDIRVVDTTTGRIVETMRVKEEIESAGWDMSIGYESMSFGGNTFKKTPLGEACRRAITKAVSRLATTTGSSKWTALVVDFDGENIIINAGFSAGIKSGDRFIAEVVQKKLTDPATGQVLSVRTRQIGTIEIVTIEEKIATGTYIPLGTEEPERGDLVVEMKK